jgi:hypothetical protein
MRRHRICFLRRMCSRLDYTSATWTNGSFVSDMGDLISLLADMVHLCLLWATSSLRKHFHFFMPAQDQRLLPCDNKEKRSAFS